MAEEKQDQEIKETKKDKKQKVKTNKQHKKFNLKVDVFKKLTKGQIITLIVLAVFTIAVWAFSQYLFGENSIFNKNISANLTLNKLYHKIPAVIKSVQIITIAWAVSLLIRTLLRKIFAKSNRGITILKLISSFIKYLIFIIVFMLILNAFGVNAKTLLASAGILSLIVGLGAQSLISDIIAGTFIVFEGEYQVGDIVIIDGWRGTVDEIGIRTTKIIDWQGNIKIINNSSISSVINQSKELSVTTCVVAIDYRESIPNVELLIKNNIEKIRQAIPEIVDGPYYKGVDSLGDSSVNLLFIATVKESDYYVVQRALNREIKLLFDANNVSIPFPQITINKPDVEEKKIKPKDVKQAQEFAAQQREISKQMEDTNK